MKYGVREICDVVLKRKSPGYFGKLYLDKGAPVMYFDTMKTSSQRARQQQYMLKAEKVIHVQQLGKVTVLLPLLWKML